MEVSKIRGTFLGCPNNKDCSILGSILGYLTLILGNYHIGNRHIGINGLSGISIVSYTVFPDSLLNYGLLE